MRGCPWPQAWSTPPRHSRWPAHIFICLLAYYVRWHMERAWAPLLFRDENKPLAEDVVAPARRSSSARAKAPTQHLEDGTPVHSFRSLLTQLATLTKNTVRVPSSTATFEKLATALRFRRAPFNSWASRRPCSQNVHRDTEFSRTRLGAGTSNRG